MRPPRPLVVGTAPVLPASVRRASVLLAAVLLASALSACSAGGPAPLPTAALPVLDVSTVDPAHTDADVAFAQAYLPVQNQGNELAALALQNSRDRRVRRVAGEMAARNEQVVPELTLLLSAWGAAVPGGLEGADEPTAAATAATLLGADEVAGLVTAPPAAFDPTFLRLAAAHHEAAAQLARTQLDQGTNPQARRLAADSLDGHTEALAVVQAAQADR